MVERQKKAQNIEASSYPAVFEEVRDDLEELDSTFEGVFAFLAGLYDTGRGGFYRSISDRKNPGGGPRLESTGIGVDLLSSGSVVKKLPDSMRRDIIRYVQGLQDPATGFFEDTQETSMHPNKRLGRAVKSAVKTLNTLGAEPLYPLPGSNPEQAQRLKYLWDRHAFQLWAEEARRPRGGSVGSNVQSQGVFIKSLPNAKRKTAISMMVDWLESERDSSTGLWWWGRGGRVSYG